MSCLSSSVSLSVSFAVLPRLGIRNGFFASCVPGRVILIIVLRDVMRCCVMAFDIAGDVHYDRRFCIYMTTIAECRCPFPYSVARTDWHGMGWGWGMVSRTHPTAPLFHSSVPLHTAAARSRVQVRLSAKFCTALASITVAGTDDMHDHSVAGYRQWLAFLYMGPGWAAGRRLHTTHHYHSSPRPSHGTHAHAQPSESDGVW